MFRRGNSQGSGCCYETGNNRLTPQHALAKTEMFLARVLLSSVTSALRYFLPFGQLIDRSDVINDDAQEIMESSYSWSTERSVRIHEMVTYGDYLNTCFCK